MHNKTPDYHRFQAEGRLLDNNNKLANTSPRKILAILLASLIIIYPILLTINFGSAADNPLLNLSPLSGPVGTVVTVNGQGFQSGSTITLIFASQIIQLIKLEASQTSFSTTFPVSNVSAGMYDVAAEASDGKTVIVLFEVTRETPTIIFTPNSATPGTIITISGTGFPKSTLSETYEVQIKGRYAFTEYFISGSGQTDSEGKFQFTAPALDYMGTLTAYAYKTLGGNTYTNYNLSAQCPTFTVIPSLTLTPSSGAPGTNVTATARGFSSLSTNRLMWDTTQLNLYTLSETRQDYIQIGMHQFSFTTTFTVPNTSLGTYTIQAQQTYESDPYNTPENGKTASATFTVKSTTTTTQTPTTTQTANPTTTPNPTSPTPTNTKTPITPTPTPETIPTISTSPTENPQFSPTQTTQHIPTEAPTYQTNSSIYLIIGVIALIVVIATVSLLLRKRHQKSSDP